MNKLKAIGYLRYSDKKQDGNHSIVIQKSQIKLLAERENLEIIEWRMDKATSAFHNNAGKRKGMQMVLNDISNGAEAICFYEESRITRSITDFYNEVYTPIKNEYPQTKFFSTQSDGEWDPNDPITQAKLVFAAEESEIKSVRSKDAHENLLNQDKPKRPGSRVPIGYDMVEGVLLPNDDAKIVELIFYLASFGHSQKTIAEYLNKSDIKTKKVTHWNSSTIGYVLSNQAYVGNLTWNVRTSYEISKPKAEKDIDLFKNVHEAIVSPTVFHLVKQISQLKSNNGTMSTPYYLRGIIICQKCKSHLVAKDNSPKGKRGKYMIYRCQDCKKTVPIIPVHETVLSDLQRKWTTQLSNFAITSKEQLKSWSKKLNHAKVNLKQLLEKSLYNQNVLATEIANNSLLEEAFKVAQKELKDEIAYISETMDEIDRLLDDDYLHLFLKEMLQQSFFNFTDSELRVFFLMYFDEVTIDFEANNDIQISYRLSPFVLLENMTGHITEQISKFGDLTG
nr:recombinase family protein [Paenibacillus bovis]